MGLADQLTLVRVAAVPLVVVLYVADFNGHDYWATGVFILAMTTDWFYGRVARSRGHTSRWARFSIRSRTRCSSSPS